MVGDVTERSVMVVGLLPPAPLGRFLPRLGPVGCRQRGLFRCDTNSDRSAHLLSSPRKRGPITTASGIWVPSISAFTRVHSPSKTGVNALNDALCAGTTSVYVMRSRAAGWCRSLESIAASDLPKK